MVISPSHSLIILFPSHSGNLTISLSDHLIPLTVVDLPSHSLIILFPSTVVRSHHLTVKGIRWSESGRSHHLTLWSLSEGDKMIREWDGDHLIPTVRQWNKMIGDLRSDHLFPVVTVVITMTLWVRSWFPLCASGNLTISESDHLEIPTVRRE